jgi:DNA (cytosine-5)-methyltransferase 1
VLAQFKEKLAALGYGFDAKIVNAAKFGVPQNRKRTIGLAFNLEKYAEEFEVLESNAKLKKIVTVQETIGHLPPLAPGESSSSVPNHRARALSDLNLKRISCALPGETNRYLKDTVYGDLSLDCHQRLEERQGKASFSDTYTRMRGDDVAPTITTRCVSVSNGRFAHYDIKQNRAITPREAALLQTFPRSYIFYPEDSLDFASTLIGNAVPPQLAKFFGAYIKERLPI